MNEYIWRDPGWPNFTVERSDLAGDLDAIRKEQYAFIGAVWLESSDERLASTIDVLTKTTLASSLIEGEVLDQVAVRSSVARRLGVNDGDVNGRIARAIADLAIAQDERSADRFYSLSMQMQRDRSHYYDALEFGQRGTLDITAWTRWFIGCLVRAIRSSQSVVERARHASTFWQIHEDQAFNDRQRKVLWRVLGNFEGDLNLRKYIAISGSARATAQRDLATLVERGVLVPEGRGKTTRYRLIATKT